MRSLLKDFRHGFRLLTQSPGFFSVAIITLAIGIGGNSAIFSVVNAVLLRPLNYLEPERLVLINHDYPQLDLRASVSGFGYRHYRDNAVSFESLGAFSGSSFNLTGEGEPLRASGMLVTASFIETLGVAPLHGRNFSEQEEAAGHDKVVILSHALWQKAFAGRTSILDQTVMLNGEPYDVIGIMPPHFQFGREMGWAVDLWTPLVLTPDQLSSNALTWEFLTVVCRLKPGVSLERAQGEMDTIAANLRQEFMPGRDRSYWGLTVESLHERLVGQIEPAALILLGAVGFVLLIACANVANLLLARGSVRRREIGIREALGASRLRIIRQLLTESVVLSLLGGALGLLLAYWGVALFRTLEQIRIPRAHEIDLDASVLAVTALVSVLTGILAGLAPALQISRSDYEVLKEGGRAGTSGARQRVRSFLVALETAVALILLIGAGLLIKSFQQLQEVHPGFEAERVLTLHLSLPSVGYAEPAQVDSFFRLTLQEIRNLAQVESAGAVSVLPMSGGGSSGSFSIEGREVPEGEQRPHGARWSATPGYFEAMQIPLMRGRYFDHRDTAEAPGVAIIDEALARKYWPGEDPLGKRIVFEGTRQDPRWREIVGIVAHVKHEGLEGDSRVQYYIPHSQRSARDMFLVVRAAGDPAALSGPVRRAIQRIDRNLPIHRVTTMEQMVADSLAARRFATFLLGIFAAMAVTLAAVGIYGVTAFNINQRTHELGVRMALGAGRGEVVRLVLGGGLLLTLAGLGAGILGAFLLTRLMSSLLFEVRPTDLTVFAAVPALLLAVSILAAYLPARRATRVDPSIALRYE